MALDQGTIAVALINGQMTIVRAMREHHKGDRLLDVELYKPLARNLFIAESSTCSRARIYSTDLRLIFPDSTPVRHLDKKMMELPRSAYAQFTELSTGHSRRIDNMWGSAMTKMRVRLR